MEAVSGCVDEMKVRDQRAQGSCWLPPNQLILFNLEVRVTQGGSYDTHPDPMQWIQVDPS